MLHYYRELSWKQHQESSERNLYAMLCIGAIEQHGPHLAVGTDDLIIEYFATALSEMKRSFRKFTCCLPLHFGLSPEHMNLCGTITLTPETLMAVMGDILASLKQHGWEKLVI